MITKKKLSYEGPVCEVFEVQSEAVMQAGSPNNSRGLRGFSTDPGSGEGGITDDTDGWGN